DFGEWEVLLNPARGFDKVDGVIVVLLDAGRDGEDVRIENDVLRREAGLLGGGFVGAWANFDFSVGGIGPGAFVEGHDDDGCAVTPDELRLLNEFPFAFLQTD